MSSRQQPRNPHPTLMAVRTGGKLSAAQYAAIERDLAPPHVNASTTDLQAGFQLGIQAALKLLRSEYVELA